VLTCQRFVAFESGDPDTSDRTPKLRLTASHHKAANAIKAMPEEDKEEINRKSGLAYAAAFSLFAAVVSGLIAGWLLDRWLGTRPWLLVVGIVLGSAAGFYEFIRASSKLS
jgi:ATP synthase protein I